jgi:hypothetical protein
LALGTRTRKAAESAAADAHAAVAEIRVEESLLRQLLAAVQRVESKMDLLLEKEDAMNAEQQKAWDSLTAAVGRETDVTQSAITLITNMSRQMKEVSVDPNVQALADQMAANAQNLAQAITANTPAATPANQAGADQSQQQQQDNGGRLAGDNG